MFRKRYWTVKRNRKGVFPMKIVIGQDDAGYYVEQIIGGNTRTVLEYAIATRKKAWCIAESWAEHYSKLGRDIRITDISGH